MRVEISTTTSTSQTHFEKELQQYFPDLHTLWSLTKFDKNHKHVLDAITDMVNNNAYGTIEIHYQNGKVTYVFKRENLTARP